MPRLGGQVILAGRQGTSGSKLLEKLPLDEHRRLGSLLLAAARDRLALRIEPATWRGLVHGAEADHDQGLVGLVGERIERATRQHQRLVLLERRQWPVEPIELRLAL